MARRRRSPRHPRPATRGGCSRRRPRCLRSRPLCTHGVPPPAAAAASSADQQQALLEQLLAEVHRKERRAAALHAELEELRGECLCLAARLGRHDLLERRDVEI